MAITLNDGEVDLIIEIIGESLPEDADKATNPIECNLLDRLIELRNFAKRLDPACPGRDVEPGAPHIYKDGECVFCKTRDPKNSA